MYKIFWGRRPHLRGWRPPPGTSPGSAPGLGNYLHDLKTPNVQIISYMTKEIN